MIKVSVIVPIYKVENFITRCAKSLMEQTLNEVEYIFVNDASPDDSMVRLHDILSKYPDRQSFIRIIEHENNKGLPAARNSGLSIASGEYIFHCDSDDYVETDMLEKLYNAGANNDADIVWCDWFLALKYNNYYREEPCYKDSFEAIKGMLTGSMIYNVWNKLVKRELYLKNKIVFPEGNAMGEDLTMISLFAYSSKLCYVPKAFYHYVKLNTNSYTNSYSEVNIKALVSNIGKISSRLYDVYGDKLNLEICFLKLNSKLFLLLSKNIQMYKIWNTMFIEANLYIWKNSKQSVRLRCLEWLAYKKQYWIVWLHYWIICKFYYMMRYK